MPAESASGERFARDMRRIRETRNVSQDDIHEETRIAITIISAFEQDGLFEHPAFNRVYLRSFVRAYAGCIDIDPELALNHLERALAGEYENELAARILDTTPSMGGYEVREPDDSGSDQHDAGVSSPVDRPLSKQEQEPQKFSPRPIGGETEHSADDEQTDNEHGVEKPAVDASSESSRESDGISQDSPEKGEDDRQGEAPNAAEKEMKQPPAKETSTPKPPDDTSSPDAAPDRPTSSEETRSDSSDEAEASGPTRRKDTSAAQTESTRDNPDEAVPPSSSFTGEASGTVGGTVFNKRPMGSGSRDAPDEKNADASEKDAVDETPAEEVAPGTQQKTEDTKTSHPNRGTGGTTESAESGDTPDEKRPKEEDGSSDLSPAQRFRTATGGSSDSPPPPPQGEMVGKPRPVGSATNTTRSARDSSREPVESPMAARSEKQRADRDLRVSEVFEDNRTLVIGGAAVVGVLIVSIALWLFFSGGSNNEQTATSTATSPQSQTANGQPDTLGASAEGDTGATRRSQPPQANLVLGDTLQLVVEAQTDVLGMKIQRDGDVRRPYWINAGETMAFPFTDRIIVWDNIQNVNLYLERYRYPETQHIDPRGRVVVTRDSAEVFAQTVRGGPASFPTPSLRPLDETFPDPEPEQTTPEDTSVPSETVPPDVSSNDDTSADTLFSHTSSPGRSS